MKEQHESARPTAELAWRRAELALEAHAVDNPGERRVIRAQLVEVESILAERQWLAEAEAALPVQWEAIYGEEPGILALFSGERRGATLTQPHLAYLPWPDEAATAARWCMAEASQARELYQCAHLLTEPHRRKRAAAPLSSLYVDLDSGVPPPPELTPTVVVESSPGRLQCYFRLTHPVAPEAGEQLNRRLGRALGADPSGWDLTQLLRVPGTRNHKYPERPRVRLTSLSATCYDPERLDQLLPPAPVSLRLTPRSTPIERTLTRSMTELALPPVRLSARGQRVWEGRRPKRTPEGAIDRSASLVTIARVLYDAGAPIETIAAALAERDQRLGWGKYDGRADAATQYARIVELVARVRSCRIE